MRFTPLLLASFVVVAGSCDDAVAPKMQTQNPAPFVSFTALPTCGPTPAGGTPAPTIFTKWLQCGEVVTINVVETGLPVGAQPTLDLRVQQVEAAMRKWNTVLLEKGSYNLPRFNVTATTLPPAPGLKTLTFDYSQGDAKFCGNASQFGGTIKGYGASDTKCVISGDFGALLIPVSDMDVLLFHEIGHMLGYKHPTDMRGELSDCLMVIDSIEGINELQCDYERQVFYYYYGLRQTVPVINGFLTAFTITPGPTTLTSRQSQSFTANVSANHAVTWTVNHGSIVLTNATSNPVTATAKVIATGRTTKLIATVNDAPDVPFPFPTKYVPITIIPLPATSIVINPASATAGIGTSVVFKGKAYTEAPAEIIPGKKFEWTVSGPATISGSTTAASVTVIGTAAGTATITATADGISRSAILTVIEPAVVDSIGVTPSGPSALPGDTIIFVGDAWSQHTPRQAMPGVYFKWSVDAGAHIVGSDSAPSVRVVADQPGSWIVTARTSGSVLGSTVLNVQAPPPVNNAPVARFAVSCQNLTCSLQNTSYDPDGTTPSALWNFGDGNTSTTFYTSSHVYASAGTYTITLTATDAGGLSNSTSQTVTVSVPPGPPPASFTWQQEAGNVRSFIFQAVSGSDNYHWNWGDGTSTSGPSAFQYHTYATCGSKTVTLTVTRAGVTANSSQTIPVCPIE